MNRLLPSEFTPENLYPEHLKLCAANKLQLEYLTMKAANLAN
jgi:hypothetical protein